MKNVKNIISVVLAFFRLAIRKLFDFRNKRFGLIERISPNVLLEFQRGGKVIVTEHYRLGSTRAILSRGFCDQTQPLDRVREDFTREMKRLRDYENHIDHLTT